ncbi:DUF2470 domain-containing protein [Aquabacter sp. CN5-332]|uniref:HugZ family pyridoxamine 5'-phosphate oxidase n=1 Tax=Aquabacter sp. CN5-332 TaxID=3156608 RepID=UPI0032B56128
MPAEPSATVIRLIHEARFGSLATLEEGGAPYASLVAVAPDEAGAPIFLLSDLARHTRNLKRDPRVSLLLVDDARGDPMNAPRASLIGRAAGISEQDARRRFLERHGDAALYADFADFGFYRLSMEEAHLVQGFGRISTLAGEAVAIDWAGAEAVRAAQDGIIAHMNEDHADAIDLYAQKLLGAEGAGWRMLAVDPLGCDLMRDASVKRLEFPQRITSVVAVREVLVELVHKARG